MGLDGKTESPLRILESALEKYAGKIAIACSFGKDSLTVLHMARQLNPQIPVLYVNTGLDFPETAAFKDRLGGEWDLNLKEFRPTEDSVRYRTSLDADLHLSDPNLCCDLLKSEPTLRALNGLDAWIVGLRRDETEFRSDLQPIEELERADGGILVRVAPIYDWSEEDVWSYIRTYRVPYHPLYDMGYRSMGCMPCSKSGQRGRYERAGRWVSLSKQECGMHAVLKRRTEDVVAPRTVAVAKRSEGAEDR